MIDETYDTIITLVSDAHYQAPLSITVTVDRDSILLQVVEDCWHSEDTAPERKPNGDEDKGRDTTNLTTRESGLTSSAQSEYLSEYLGHSLSYLVEVLMITRSVRETLRLFEKNHSYDTDR